MDDAALLKDSYRELRNVLRKQMRWKREKFGEEMLRSMQDTAFLCYEDINTFGRLFPTQQSRDEYLDQLRSQIRWTERIEQSLLPGLLRGLSSIADSR